MSNHIYPQHYTYEITNKKGNRYIGVRSCNCNPNNDPYMGTCKTLDGLKKRERLNCKKSRRSQREFGCPLRSIHYVAVKREIPR